MNWQENVLSHNKSSLKLPSSGKYIYVFTPKGDVIELPHGATPIDFAYRVHSSLGNTMVGAVVNNKLVSLDTHLNNGDVCLITTDKNRKKPSADWMRIAQTSYARSCIRRSLV
jgi:GTP pyrophosphokinase